MDDISICVFRDENERLRLRKWTLEVHSIQMVDRRRMFGGLFFKLRLKRKLQMMLKRRSQILEVEKELGYKIEY